MAVPAHDERDLEFARKFALPIRQVVAPAAVPGASSTGSRAVSPGKAVVVQSELPRRSCRRPRPNSASSPGWKSKAAANARSTISCATGFSPANVIGASRSRSSGATANTNSYPKANFRSNRRRSPISSRPAPASRPWPEPRIGSGIRTPPTRETNTMPQWAGSCWYYLRYCDPHNAENFVGQEAERYWMDSGKPGGVDLYVGGTEHAVLHLLVRAVLAQGAARPRPGLDAGAVSEAGQPGADPGRGRSENVEEQRRQRGQS